MTGNISPPALTRLTVQLYSGIVLVLVIPSWRVVCAGSRYAAGAEVCLEVFGAELKEQLGVGVV